MILSKPENLPRTPEKDEKLAARIQKQYPIAADKLRHRAERYNAGVALAQQYAAQGKAVIIAPDDTCGIDTLTRNAEALHRFYEKGYRDAQKISAYLQNEEN